MEIIGLTRSQDVAAAHAAGASYVGYNFFPKSPRCLTPDAARALAIDTPAGLAKVGLVVAADDALLDRITGTVPLDILQLHGGEQPRRVAQIRARYGLPVMKVIGIAEAADVPQIARFEQVADLILIDAKPSRDAVLPGGNGIVFDWHLLAGRKWARPWMLAGGLTPENVARAMALTGAAQVDVASGVESAPGIKDAERMAAFVSAARSAEPVPQL